MTEEKEEDDQMEGEVNGGQDEAQKREEELVRQK